MAGTVNNARIITDLNHSWLIFRKPSASTIYQALFDKSGL